MVATTSKIKVRIWINAEPFTDRYTFALHSAAQREWFIEGTRRFYSRAEAQRSAVQLAKHFGFEIIKGATDATD